MTETSVVVFATSSVCHYLKLCLLATN